MHGEKLFLVHHSNTAQRLDSNGLYRQTLRCADRQYEDGNGSNINYIDVLCKSERSHWYISLISNLSQKVIKITYAFELWEREKCN